MKKILFVILTLLIILGLSFGIYSYYIVNKINTVEFTDNNEELGIKENIKNNQQEKVKEEITNIAIFGIDSRSTKDQGRSDSIMILTIDTKHNKVKLTSLMRDSYVNIDPYGYDKLNHAYAYGGPLLAVKTINQNFNTDIKEYITVNFESVIDIINYFGGVNIYISQEEMELINKYQYEAEMITGKPTDILGEYGNVTLSGMQALSYSRIRDLGNGDFDRTERQRTVLNALMKKAKTLDITNIPGIISSVAPMITTSLTKGEMISLASNTLKNISDFEQQRFPLDGYCENLIIDDIWYLQFDEKATAEQIYNYLFLDIKPVNKDPLF